MGKPIRIQGLTYAFNFTLDFITKTWMDFCCWQYVVFLLLFDMYVLTFFWKVEFESLFRFSSYKEAYMYMYMYYDKNKHGLQIRQHMRF